MSAQPALRRKTSHDHRPHSPNRLYFGDNLDILRQYVPDESVDLIYLDPPFNSNATYNVLFRERSGEESAAQITAFEDTWHWGWESETAYQDVVTQAAGTRSAASSPPCASSSARTT